MRFVTKFAVLGLTVACMTGCRLKGVESFTSATTPNPPGTWSGDTYANGGNAYSTGGLKPATHYGEGAATVGTGKVDSSYDQAAKGTGQQAGEYPNVAAAGHGQTNAPSFQPQPGAAVNTDQTHG